MILLDGFSGIGGFPKGLQNAGIKFSKHFFSEIDKHAIANYTYNFKKAHYVGAIEHINRNQLPTADLFTFGWPCQDNSIAGKRKGQSNRYRWTSRDEKILSYKRYKKIRNSFTFYLGERKDSTRSGLLYEANRVKRELQPHTFIAENVKGLLSVNGGIDIIEAIRLLTDIDTGSPQYTLEMQLFNTSWFLPQNRERLYFVGHRGTSSRQQILPFTESNRTFNEKRSRRACRHTSTIVSSYYKGGKGTHIQVGTWRTHKEDQGFRENKQNICPTIPARARQDGSGQPVLSVRPVITPDRKNKRQNGRRIKDNGEPAFTLSTQDRHGVMIENSRIRRLTEIECERLQGFPDNWTSKGKYDIKIKNISTTQRYKQTGNAVSTVIVTEIGKKLLKIWSEK